MRQAEFKDVFLNVLASKSLLASGADERSESPNFTIVQFPGRTIKFLCSAACDRLETAIDKETLQQTFSNVPTGSLLQLQSICVESMEGLEALPDLKTLSTSDWAMIPDILSAIRITLLLMSRRPEALALQSEDALRLSLRTLGVVVFIIYESHPTGLLAGVRDTVFREVLEFSARTVRIVNELVKSISVTIVVSELEDIAFRIVHPSYLLDQPHKSGAVRRGIIALRDAALELISNLFLSFQEERPFMMTATIASTLTDRHIRQHKVVGESNISVQTATVLLIRFVQMYAISPTTTHFVQRGNALGEDEIDSAFDSVQIDPAFDSHSQRGIGKELSESLTAATTCAQEAIHRLMVNVSEGGLQNPRPRYAFLRMFCEDLVSVVHLPEWAGAEMLLRFLLPSTLKLAQESGHSDPLKLLALDLLAVMGGAISQLYTTIQNATTESLIKHATDRSANGRLDVTGLVGWRGLYHIVLEHLRCDWTQDIQIGTARVQLLATWMHSALCNTLLAGEEVDRIKAWLDDIVNEQEVNALGPRFDAQSQVRSAQGRLAYLMIVLACKFGPALEQIISVLRDSLEHTLVPVRMRSMKGLVQIFGNNRYILGRTSGVVARCLRDPSIKVRESALASLWNQPEWEESLEECVEEGLRNSSPTIRKHFIKVSEDLYLRQGPSASKPPGYILRSVLDGDPKVAETARKALERFWLPSVQSDYDHQALERTLEVIVAIILREPSLEPSLCHFIAVQQGVPNIAGCSSLLVAALSRVTNERIGEEERCHMLRVLAIFAKANGALFTPSQNLIFLELMSASGPGRCQQSFEHAADIFGHVTRKQHSLDPGTYGQAEDTLLQLLTSCTRGEEMEHITMCLWTICARLGSSWKILDLIITLRQQLASFPAKTSIRLLGYIGKNCFREGHQATKIDLSSRHWYPVSVVRLLLDIFQDRSCSLRWFALRSMGMICHSWPSLIVDEELSMTFEVILTGNDPNSQRLVLDTFIDCLVSREFESWSFQKNASLESTHGSSRDQVAFLLIKQYLDVILRLARQSLGKIAFRCVVFIATASRQGLVMPSQVYSTMVALGTSPDPETAQIANEEHTRMHKRQRSAVNNHYKEAIRKSFEYQHDVAKDPRGTKSRRPKLCFLFRAVIANSNEFKKFIQHEVVSGLVDATQRKDLLYLRYIVENMAFYGFEQPNELGYSIRRLELFSQTLADHNGNDELLYAKNLGQQSTEYVALSIVWEVLEFLRRAKAAASEQTGSFGDVLKQQHQDNGSVLLNAVARKLESCGQ